MKEVFDIHVHYTFEMRVKTMVELFRRELDMTGAYKVNFLSLPHGYSGDKLLTDRTQNIKGLFLKKMFAPRGYCFAGLVHPIGADDEEYSRSLLNQAEEFLAAGYDGIKMFEGNPQLRKIIGKPLDSPVYDKFYSFLEERGAPVIMHIANPEENWDITKVSAYAKSVGRFCDETVPTKAQLHSEVDGIMKKHPRLKLTLAHMGFLTYNIADAERFLDGYENTMFDVTPGGEQLFNMLQDWNSWHGFFQKYRKRIMYGTDLYAFPYITERDWIADVMRRPQFLREFFETDTKHSYIGDIFRGVKLEEDILSDVYSGNAERLFGEPKAIDGGYLSYNISRYITDADDLKYMTARI